MTNHSLRNDLMGRFHYNQRNILRLLLLAFALAVLFVCLRLPLLHGLRPNFYQPARPDLTRAKIHLSAFYDDEQSLISELTQTHRQLLMTLALLSKAESQLSPDDRALLDRVRKRLRVLEREHASRRMTPEALRQTYHNLAAALENLIDGSD
jgi:hypothetical protein